VARTAITVRVPPNTSPVIVPELEGVGDGVDIDGRICSGGMVCVGDGDGEAIEQDVKDSCE